MGGLHLLQRRRQQALECRQVSIASGLGDQHIALQLPELVLTGDQHVQLLLGLWRQQIGVDLAVIDLNDEHGLIPQMKNPPAPKHRRESSL